MATNMAPIRKLAASGLAAIAMLLAMPIDVPSFRKGAFATELSPTAKPRFSPSPETVSRLTAWIVARTGWVAKEPPTIRFASSAQLGKLYYGEDNGPGQISIKGLYEFSTHVITLSDSWNQDDLRDLSYLLHELVHHLQILNNVEVPCENAYDIDAYHLQFDWLREQGIRDPKAFLGTNDVVQFSTAQCPVYRGCDFLPEGCQK